MNHVKILDCTLRDGAYLVDKTFGDTAIHGIINGLADSKVDFIEIGFLQDEGYGPGKTVFKNAADAKRFVPVDKKNSLYTVLADYSRYSIDNLDENKGDSFDAVRACFFKKERKNVLDFCREIKRKGYKLFVQPVDILGYSDFELLDLIRDINEIEPYCVSIVDTFGSMYEDDLQRVFNLIDHNLVKTSCIGFHSHNNMQMSNALSQSFARMTLGKRTAVIDGTLSGMGRGAGNTPTELIVQYMVSKFGATYDMDAIFDLIDGYIDNMRARCSWGYSTSMFIAGCYSAHVNNISYLLKKNCISSKDIRYILNKIGEDNRKRYHYDLLESTYLELLNSAYDDKENLRNLREKLKEKKILVVAPGKSAHTQETVIQQFIEMKNPVVITVNFLHEHLKSNYMFLSNANRMRYWSCDSQYESVEKIMTSNLSKSARRSDYVISYSRLIKCGWENMENSMILLLRLLDFLSVGEINIAGFDGYTFKAEGNGNYAQTSLELDNAFENAVFVNQEITEMLLDFNKCRQSQADIKFITPSRFSTVFEEER